MIAVTLLSIIIPVKNEGTNLIELCKSIVRQCCKEHFEVVIVDDSDPKYEEYVAKCFDTMRNAGVNVRLLRGGQQGVGVAMYRGLVATNSVYVLFLDADNILRENFMLKTVPLLEKSSFVSMLSKGVILRGWRGLYYAGQLPAVLRRGLIFHRKYGFVNILYIWQRDLILASSKIMYSKLSLLDQIDLRRLEEIHIIKTKNHVHIDEVLIENHRHVYEAYNLGFIYGRLRWYWTACGNMEGILRLADVKIYLLLLPLIILLMTILSIILGFKLLLTLISLYLTFLGITEVSARISHKYPLIEFITGTVWLPTYLIVKSILAYAVIISLVKHDIG